MTFPFPVMLAGHEWGTSTWTDFKDKWAGDTYLGSYSTGVVMPDWTMVGPSSTISQVDTSAGSISGQAYHHRATGVAGTSGYIYWNTPGSLGNFDMLVGGRVISHAGAPQGSVGFGPAARIGTGQRITATLSGPSATPRTWVSLFSIISTSIFSSDQLFSWALSTGYWLRLNLSGGTIRIKAWQRGSAEPGSWLFTWAPGTVPLSGFAGVNMAFDSISEQFVDFFSVQTDGTPAWGPL